MYVLLLRYRVGLARRICASASVNGVDCRAGLAETIVGL